MTALRLSAAAGRLRRAYERERGLPRVRYPPLDRSTFYSWKQRIERHGLEILHPRERRRPQEPNQLSPFVDERNVAFALGHPGLGPNRAAAELARARWGGLLVSHNGIWRCLKRHGLNTRGKRLFLVAGFAASSEPPCEPEPERHLAAERPGAPEGMDSFYVGRLTGTKGAVWHLTAIDVASSYARPSSSAARAAIPTGEQTSKLARRVAAQLQAAGWATRARPHRQLRRVPLDQLRSTSTGSAPVTP
jgi:hypothetical protein